MEHKQAPHFQSDIPPHLLANVSPQERYIMEHLSILGQRGVWLEQVQKEQSNSLENLKGITEEIKAQTTKTNGSVLLLKDQAKKAEEVVNFYNSGKRLINNKLFVLASVFGAIVFFSYVAPWLMLNGKAILPTIFKAILGA